MDWGLGYATASLCCHWGTELGNSPGLVLCHFIVIQRCCHSDREKVQTSPITDDTVLFSLQFFWLRSCSLRGHVNMTLNIILDIFGVQYFEPKKNCFQNDLLPLLPPPHLPAPSPQKYLNLSPHKPNQLKMVDNQINVQDLCCPPSDWTGRGMNAAFAIGRLCDLEAGCVRILSLQESRRMVSCWTKCQ